MDETVNDDGNKIVPIGRWNEQLDKKHGTPTPVKSKDEFSRDKNRANIASSLENAMLAIRKLSVKFRYDLFRGKVVIEGYEQPLGETLDDIVLKVRQVIISAFGFDPEGKNTREAIRALAMENAFDPVKDYLDGLVWDGEPRLDTWLRDFLGAPDDELTSAIGRAVLIAGVRRVRKPGCKFDFAMVLEGKQGSGKSTALKVLAGGETYFSDEIVVGESYKDQQELLQGKHIVELPELAGLRLSEVRKVKSFITKTYDRARPAFARSVEEAPRRCILIGTTNDSDYLQDPTGNRRFMPVVTGKIDLAGLTAVRDQLWAEAASAEPDAADPITIPQSLWAAAERRQEERVEADPWEDILAVGLPAVAKAVDGELRVTTHSVLEHVLMIEPNTASKVQTRRVSECMRRLGWEPKPMRSGDAVLRGYAKPVEEKTYG